MSADRRWRIREILVEQVASNDRGALEDGDRAEANAEAGPAVLAACGERGNATFCTKPRLFAAEVAIRERRQDATVSALAACAAVETIDKDAVLRRRLVLLRARHARLGGDSGSSEAFLIGFRAEPDVSDDELAQIDLESSLLARERHRNADATEALAKARQHLAAYLSQPTPVIGEIDSALAAARRSRQPARPANTVLTRGLLSQRH